MKNGCALKRKIKSTYYERVSLTNFNSTLEYFNLNYISIVVFLKEGLVQVPLQKHRSLIPLKSVLKK